VLPVADGLDVRTETAVTVEARRNTLRLLLGSYRPGAECEGNELLALAARYGVGAPREPRPSPLPVDDSNPLIRVDSGAMQDREVFEDDRIYNQVFDQSRLKADSRKIVLCYKVQFRLRRLVYDIVDRGANKYAYGSALGTSSGRCSARRS
jgi:hypothetical protein